MIAPQGPENGFNDPQFVISGAMTKDTGTDWDQRRLANSRVSGSIPARVSILQSWTDVPGLRRYGLSGVRFWAGRMFARWVLHAPHGFRSFRAGLLYDIETTHALSPKMIERARLARMSGEKGRQLEIYKHKMIAAHREVSRLRRLSKQRGIRTD